MQLRSVGDVISIEIVQLDPDLALRAVARAGDAGIDLFARTDATLQAHGGRVLMPTGIAIALPVGYAGFVLPRSGNALKYGVTVVNSPGLIDSGYRGEIMVVLLNTEPAFDAANGAAAAQAIGQAEMVVTLSPFKANMDISDVLLPVSPFTETAGTFVNTEARAQSFHGVVKPLGETRPAWKVLRVLGSMLKLPGFEFETIEEV